MKKSLANLLVAFFVLFIIGGSTTARNIQPGDVGGALAILVTYILLFVGLFYSARWRVKLAGHNYKVGRQTTAAILFWYSVLAAVVGLITAFTFSLLFGAIMVVVWSSLGYLCKRWLNRLRLEERSRAVPSQPQTRFA